MSDQRAEAAIPIAAALICAVADRDVLDVDRILNAPDLDWRALCVVLAGHVRDDTEIGDSAPLTVRRQRDLALHLAAEAFDTTAQGILAGARTRNVVDARAVAMAALRWTGQSASWIGREFGRDHSTVLHAVGRVGEDQRLRPIARTIADRITGRGRLGLEVA